MIKGAAFDPAKQVAVATSDTTELGTVSYATVINPANASFLAGEKAFFLNDNKGGGGLAKTVIRYACPGVPLGTVVTKVDPKK